MINYKDITNEGLIAENFNKFFSDIGLGPISEKNKKYCKKY